MLIGTGDGCHGMGWQWQWRRATFHDGPDITGFLSIQTNKIIIKTGKEVYIRGMPATTTTTTTTNDDNESGLVGQISAVNRRQSPTHSRPTIKTMDKKRPFFNGDNTNHLLPYQYSTQSPTYLSTNPHSTLHSPSLHSTNPFSFYTPTPSIHPSNHLILEPKKKPYPSIHPRLVVAVDRTESNVNASRAML